MTPIRVGCAIVFLLSVAACVDGTRRNTECAWSDPRSGPLVLENPADRNHLHQDALVAEELGLRRGDSRRGQLQISERRALTAGCTDSLFLIIAATHGVSLGEAHAAALERNLLIDLVLVLVPALALLWGAATLLTARVHQRFLPDEPVADVVATVLLGVMVVGLWFFAGEMWSWLVEMMRLRDSHISYRAERLPWYRFGVLVFVLGVAVYGWVGWRGRRRFPGV